MINGHSVTFDVENPDASDPHHAPFDEALVEKILNGATVPNAPVMLDMAANTDTFDFDVPYGNKWVDKGYIDVGYEYPMMARLTAVTSPRSACRQSSRKAPSIPTRYSCRPISSGAMGRKARERHCPCCSRRCRRCSPVSKSWDRIPF